MYTVKIGKQGIKIKNIYVMKSIVLNGYKFCPK